MPPLARRAAPPASLLPGPALAHVRTFQAAPGCRAPDEAARRRDSVSLRLLASSLQTRPSVALLGPCYKTGGARTRLPLRLAPRLTHRYFLFLVPSRV